MPIAPFLRNPNLNPVVARILGAGLLWLPGPAAWACAVCRPRVQAGIFTTACPATLALVLLPVGRLLLGGTGLFFAADIRRLLARGTA